jgi:surfeit locus 1 family protein
MTRMRTPLLFSLLFGLTGAAILIWLGVWQMQRLEWKQGILSNIENRISAESVALPEQPDPDADKFLTVFASGTLTDDEIHVLVSQKHVGAGYRVISVFVTNSGRRILLDRGFIKVDQKSAERPIGPTDVTGNLHWPEEKGSSIPEPDLKAEIWFARDVFAMAKHLDTEPVLIVARETSLIDDPVAPLPVDTVGIPNDHLQYALTWFSLALIWVLMTFTFVWRARGAQKGTS